VYRTIKQVAEQIRDEVLKLSRLLILSRDTESSEKAKEPTMPADGIMKLSDAIKLILIEHDNGEGLTSAQIRAKLREHGWEPPPQVSAYFETLVRLIKEGVISGSLPSDSAYRLYRLQ
jgi:hypothetical protein